MDLKEQVATVTRPLPELGRGLGSFHGRDHDERSHSDVRRRSYSDIRRHSGSDRQVGNDGVGGGESNANREEPARSNRRSASRSPLRSGHTSARRSREPTGSHPVRQEVEGEREFRRGASLVTTLFPLLPTPLRAVSASGCRWKLVDEGRGGLWGNNEE